MTAIEKRVQIDLRYSGLAETCSCLSCGGAIDHAAAQPGEVCVDLGSGRGQDVLRLAEQVGQGGFAYGIDTATGMLERARRDAEKLGVRNVAYLCCDFEKIELPDASADLVISNCAINHADDKGAVWSQVHRILKPGGRFVVSDIYATHEVPAVYRNDPQAVAECWAGAQERSAYFTTVRAAGFTNLTVLEESAPYPKGQIEVASFTLFGRKEAAGHCTCH